MSIMCCVATPPSPGDPTDSNIVVLVFKKIQELLFSAKFSSNFFFNFYCKYCEKN